jgi:serine O-acetyltransferase
VARRRTSGSVRPIGAEPPTLSLRDTVRADLLRACSPGERWQDVSWRRREVLAVAFDRPGVWAVVEYRLRQWVAGRPRAQRLALKPLTVLTRKLVEAVTGISIHASAQIGPGFYVGHFGSVIVGGGVRAGENLSISQDVTIGWHRGSPVLGNQVFLAPGAKAFGPITIGDHVAVGANAVVHRDVPAFSTVVAAEAHVLPDRGNMRPDRRP